MNEPNQCPGRSSEVAKGPSPAVDGSPGGKDSTINSERETMQVHTEQQIQLVQRQVARGEYQVNCDRVAEAMLAKIGASVLTSSWSSPKMVVPGNRH
jgi:hypothetical protein